MKTHVVYIIFCLGLIVCNFQTYYAQEKYKNKKNIYSENAILESLLIGQNNILSQNTIGFNINSLDQINIVQIGQTNFSKINKNSEYSDLLIFQNGTNNFVNLDIYNAKDIRSQIFQTGNNNYVNEFSLYNNFSSQAIIIQNGNNLTLYTNGMNSISDDMKINQNGYNKTIIIYNF